MINSNTQLTQFLLYKTDNDKIKVDVRIENETVWLTQKQMSELFDKERSVVTKHINNVFKEGELEEKSNVQILHISSSDRPVKFYNLDVIISVGYRVKSLQGTRFRQWATQHLKEFIIKGFTMDDERLKDPRQIFGKDYFDEEELNFFNRIVTMYLDYAELQASNQKVMYMKDWKSKLDAFLQFNEKEVLEHKGKISREIAVSLALDEYEKYRILEDKNHLSDFDKLLLEMEKNNE